MAGFHNVKGGDTPNDWPSGVVIDTPINPPKRPSIAHSGRAPRLSGEGLVMRFSPIAGQTPRTALDRKMYLPAVLSPFTVEETALHTEYDTLSAGQFSSPAQGPASARQLRDISVDSLICLFDPPWLVASGQDPWKIELALWEILRSKKPVRVMAFRRPHQLKHHDLDASVTFRRVHRELRGGESDTYYLTVEFKEWRDPRLARRAVSRKRGKTLPTTIVLTSVDTLESLSREMYGSASHWRDIRAANGIPRKFGQKTPLVKLGGHFKVGSKIKIPALTFQSTAPTTDTVRKHG